MVVVAPLLEIAVLLLTLALAALATIVIEALFKALISALSKVGLGGVLTDWLASIEQTLTNGLGRVEHGIDAAIGYSWHSFARLADQVWNSFKQAAHADWVIATSLADTIARVLHLNHLTHDLARARAGVSKQIKTIEREYTHLRHRVKAIEDKVAKGIGNDIRIHVRALEKEVTGIEQGVIPGLRAGIKTAEGEVTALENFIGAIPGTKYLAWATGIVTAALGVGLFNFFKCPTFLNKTLGRGCGFWNGVEDLLGLFIDAVALTHLCDLPRWIEELFSPLLGELTGLISSAANSLCAASNSSWAELHVAAGPLPPPQTLNLPANFG